MTALDGLRGWRRHGIAGLALAGLALLGACERPSEAPPPAAPAPPETPSRQPDPLSAVHWDPTPVDWTRPVPQTPPGGLVQPGYAGSRACEPCHKKLFASYARHSMASSGLRPLKAQDARWLTRIFDAGSGTLIKHAGSGLSYHPVRKGNRFFIEEVLAGDDGVPVHTWQEPVTHTLAAGTYGMAFYFQRGAHFYQFPIDYLAKLQRWDRDPAARDSNFRFGRALDATCISCHSDYPRRLAGSDDVFFEPMPNGIGCERCHGPGAKHVQSMKREDTVNPAHLFPARQVDVCSQCHLFQRPQMRAGRHEFSFQPGEPLDGFRVNYLGAAIEPDRVDLLAHSDRMVRSACWRASGKALTCTSCHDPHVSSVEEPPKFWDGKCMKCHAEKRCSAPPAVQARENGHCVRCHMRTGPAANIPLATITDHWIQRVPPPIRPGDMERPRSVMTWSTFVGDPVTGGDSPALDALTYLADGRADSIAGRLLAGTLQTFPQVPALYTALIQHFDREGDSASALAATRAWLRFQPDARLPLVEYARRNFAARSLDEATHALDRRLAVDPNDGIVLDLKGSLLAGTGRESEARPLYERAVAQSANALSSHKGLAVIALGAGKKQEAIVHLEAANRISPGDSSLLETLQNTYSAAGDPVQAARIAKARAFFDRRRR